MPAVAIQVPGVGESISEGILSRWLKADGSAVQAGEPLFELETDKASTVVPAAASGVLKVGAAEGATVAVGSTIGTIDPEGKPSAQAAPPARAAAGGAAAAAPARERPREAPTPPPQAAPPRREAPAAAVAARPAPDGGVAGAPSPAARRAAAEGQVDLKQVEGTGRGGRITKGDVLAELDKAHAPAPTTPATTETQGDAARTPPARPAPSGLPRETRQRMSGIRQRIAQRLVEAQQTAAILTTFNEADMSRVIELRARHKDAFKARHGVALGFMSFFVKAAIEALKAFPAVNGRVEGTDIVFNNVYDIGVAVSTERGLMVPVLRDADRLGFAELERAIADFAAKAREGKIAVEDLQGGTFTITNGGVFGSLLSTPILNPPQSGILGMHAIQKRPVVVADQIAIRPMMYLALSYDHRIVDGREAVSFLVKVKEGVEDPERLMLGI